MPTKNGGLLLDSVLNSVFNQKTDLTYEVVAVDSGSSDGTLEILHGYPVRVQQIPPEEFSHSRTRNYGASLALAKKYYVFLNQDAIPTDERWLDKLVYSIKFENGLKAVCATELKESGQPFNVSGVAAFIFRNSLAQGIYIIPPYSEGEFYTLPKHQLRQLFPFTTVCAIFDKEHFDQYPFNESIEWGEDLHWAVHNSRMGFKSGCSIFSAVYHCHNYSNKELNDIIGKSRVLFKKIFNADFDDEMSAVMSYEFCPNCIELSNTIVAMKESMSWKITQPIRNLIDKCKGR